jgi:hypothetical protein
MQTQGRPSSADDASGAPPYRLDGLQKFTTKVTKIRLEIQTAAMMFRTYRDLCVFVASFSMDARDERVAGSACIKT